MKKIFYLSAVLLACTTATQSSIDAYIPFKEKRPIDLQCIEIFDDNGIKKYTIKPEAVDDLQKRLEVEQKKYLEQISVNSNDFWTLINNPMVISTNPQFSSEHSEEGTTNNQLEYRRKILRSCRYMAIGFILESITQRALSNLRDPSPKLWQDHYWLYDSKINSTLLYTEHIRNITLPSEIEQFKMTMQELDLATWIEFYNKIKSDDDMVVIPD